MTIYAFEGAEPDLPPEGRYWVAPTAVLLGRVKLGEMASVWYGSVLRGDCELIHVGARSNVQDGCVLHTDPGFPVTIGENCTIGHMAMVHGCTISDGSLVGIGATLLNGVRVGRNCIIGAHTLLPEGREIPDRSLVMGTPGRIVREIGEDDVGTLKHLADHYVENWQRHSRGLTPVR